MTTTAVDNSVAPMKEKALLIVNPRSGTREKDDLSGSLSRLLAGHGVSLTTEYTQAPGDAGRLACEAADAGYGSVVVAGGDGTVREAATSLWGKATSLGIIPGGSGNGLARSLGIPQDFRKAMEIVAEGHVLRIDRGQAAGHSFYCTFGIGFDAAVSEKFAMERRRGRMAYVKSALVEFLKYKPETYALSIGGEILTLNALVVAVCNAPQYGNNAYIAPRAELNDGLLDITVIHSGNLLNTTLAGIELLSGRLDRNILVETFRVPSVSISRLEEGPVHLDGDPLHMGKHIDVECQPDGLEVICPSAVRGFRPIVTPLRSLFEDMITDIRFSVLNKVKN